MRDDYQYSPLREGALSDEDARELLTAMDPRSIAELTRHPNLWDWFAKVTPDQIPDYLLADLRASALIMPHEKYKGRFDYAESIRVVLRVACQVLIEIGLQHLDELPQHLSGPRS